MGHLKIYFYLDMRHSIAMSRCIGIVKEKNGWNLILSQQQLQPGWHHLSFSPRDPNFFNLHLPAASILGGTVDGWNPKQPPGMYENPISNGKINYQPQLVQDFSHQQYRGPRPNLWSRYCNEQCSRIWISAKFTYVSHSALAHADFSVFFLMANLSP